MMTSRLIQHAHTAHVCVQRASSLGSPSGGRVMLSVRSLSRNEHVVRVFNGHFVQTTRTEDSWSVARTNATDAASLLAPGAHSVYTNQLDYLSFIVLTAVFYCPFSRAPHRAHIHALARVIFTPSSPLPVRRSCNAGALKCVYNFMRAYFFFLLLGMYYHITSDRSGIISSPVAVSVSLFFVVSRQRVICVAARWQAGWLFVTLSSSMSRASTRATHLVRPPAVVLVLDARCLMLVAAIA